MKRQWKKNEIFKWYNSLPWLTGCNFLPSNVVNRLDMFQSYKKDEHLKVADDELALAEKTGFNCIRIWANFDVYYKEPRKFMQTFESYIELAQKHKQLVMIVLAYEEDLPFENQFVAKELGPQTKYYTHFNRDYVSYLKHQNNNEFRHYMEYPEIKPLFIEMVTKIVKKYRKDSRVFAWNIFNEPGIILHDRNIPLQKELFELVRSLNPMQPLCSDIYQGINNDGSYRSESERIACELSDFISYHSYTDSKEFIRALDLFIEKHGDKPIIVTEWLNRIMHNDVKDIYPYLNSKKIGSMIWGFVEGDTYVTEPWNHLWTDFYEGRNRNLDFKLWQHELFRRNHLPYDPNELEVIKKFSNLK